MAAVENLRVLIDGITSAVDVLNGSRVLNGTIKLQVTYNLPLHTGFIRNVIQCCNKIPLNSYVSWYSYTESN